VQTSAPSTVELAGAVTDQLRDYLRERRRDCEYIGTDYAELTEALEEFVLRGDVGGFGVGSEFSWQAIATYNSPLGEIHGIPVDGYVGFRALAADYSQGSGKTKFEWDNVIYGPVIGATMRF